MKEIHHQHRHHNHNPLQPNKQLLILNQRALPPLAQLHHSVYRPHKNTQRRQRQRRQERPEKLRRPQLHVRRIERLRSPHRPHPPQSADGEIHAQQNKEQQRKDLKRQPSHHDMIAHLRTLILMTRHTGHSPSGRLQHQAQHIAGDENPRITPRGDPGILGAEGRHDPRERQIQPRGQKRRRDGQTHDLHEEAVLVEGVVVGHQAADVAEHFEGAAAGEGDGEAEEAAGEGRLQEEGEEGEGEEGEEGGVGGEGGSVVVVGGLEGAGREGAGVEVVVVGGAGEEEEEGG